MAGPAFGALGATFKIVRALQAVSLIAIIGMAANFISEMVQSNKSPSDVLVGTLSIVSPSFFHGPVDSSFERPYTHVISLDLYRRPLLRNNPNPLPRLGPPIPLEHHLRYPHPHRSCRCRRRGWKTSQLPQLQGHRQQLYRRERRAIRLRAQGATAEYVKGTSWREGRVQQLDRGQ